jgi:Mg-chelatase subunit ChlD
MPSVLPHGRSTPLSAALKFTKDFLLKSKLKLKGGYWAYLITDDRTNIPLYGDIRREVTELAAELSKSAKFVVYDASLSSFYPGISHIDVLAQYAYVVEKI